MLRLLSALLPRAANLPPPAGVTSYLGKLGMQKVILTFLKDFYSQRLRDRITTLQTKNTWRVKDSRYASDFFIFFLLLVVDIIQHIINKKGLSFVLL
jgi:hypothetical protein